jgi:hypothetical protein
MRIVGFAQTMRLGVTAEEGYELNIQLDDGKEVTIPTDQSTVLALTKLWAENRKSISRVPTEKIVVPMASVSPEPFMPPPPMAEDDVDEGEVFGGNSAVSVSTDEMGYPVVKHYEKETVANSTSAMPIPRFLESDDEDGQQV